MRENKAKTIGKEKPQCSKIAQFRVEPRPNILFAAGNGYIEGSELDSFLREFASSLNAPDVNPDSVPDSMLEQLKECFMEAYDDNRDGKIEIREASLPIDFFFFQSGPTFNR
ncbi:unnamed protein product [Notodromas monacha]|uniref:Uncharacterized protein n=1 Tax=Notodromas monacha TaxID=399045 RepID=A0A7R9G7L6_9CRUS|nr:unnamed protein product [Notodromas monacha]CAG0912380.1 unnamed protein product [Notodromas monacha]